MHQSDSSSAIKASAVKADAVSSARVEPAHIAAEICELCFSDLVQPMQVEAQTDGTVRLTLRCPECHHIRIGECSWDEARKYGRQFAAGKASLRVHYNELATENLRGELDCFVLALHMDLIGPDDFQPYRFTD